MYTYVTLTSVTVIILMVAYGKTLVSTCRGSKYRFVETILVMLMLSNFGTLVLMLTNYELFIRGPNLNEP